MTRTKRATTVAVFTVLLLPALTGTAFAQLTVDDPDITVGPGPASCNGVIPTPGSENTIKTLTGGSLVPGGTAEFLIKYPVDPGDLGEWVVHDCVLMGTGSDLKDYDVLDKASFTGVANSEFFEIQLTVSIPDDAQLGDSICNVAKTTSTPSAPQSSNRKAGPACFVIGGNARVEKRSTADPDGELLEGATFEISDCNNTSPTPETQPIIATVDPDIDGVIVAEGATVEVVAVNGYIALSGPNGSTCTVTETAPPPGYKLPPVGERSIEITIPLGTDVTIYEFLDAAIEPDIDVTKSCSGPVGIGDDVSYTITVTNTGDEELVGLTVDDSLLGDVSGSFPNTLDVGDSVSREFTHTVTADDPDPLPNSVTATASGGISDKEVSDGDDCESDITHEPGISVTKDCPATALVGEEVTYTITITNTGDEELTGITVEDSLLGDISNLFPTTLDVGDSGTEEVTRVVQPGEDPVENTVTVSATGADSEETATDTASCSSNVLGPDIQIVKDGPALAHVGDTVTYSFTVTNTGEVPLFDVTITDDRCDPGTLSDFTGDTNDNGILGLEEVWHATCTHVVEKSDEDPVPNTAVVDATDREGNPTSDDDSHLVDIIHPAIEVVKSVTPQDGQPGDDVTYSYEVTNTGDTTLFDVSVDDDKLGHIGDIASLEPGESVTLTKATTLPNVAGDLTNVVVADGADELGKHVSDDDSVTVTVVLPSPPILPKTGADVGTVGQTGVLLILLGFVMVRGSRRPHPVGPASLGWQAAQVRRASLLVSWQARARGRAPSPRARGRARGRDPDAGPPHTTGP